MGYIIGGRPQVLDTAKKAEVDDKVSVTQISPITPKRSTFSHQQIQSQKAAQASMSDTTRVAPMFNDPRYTASTLSIPTDDRTLHGLYRFFSETDPIVGAGLKVNAEMPLADLRLGQCEDSGVQQHYEEMWERINGTKLLTDIAFEYHEIGNVYPFGAWNSTDYMWDQFAILNPDYVKIETTWVNTRPLVKLVPDEALKRVVQTQSPKFIYKQLPSEIIKYVLLNQEIPLDPNNVFHIAHAKRPYEAKGRSLIKRILKTLMLEDRFNQANFALATRHAVPLMIVKVGDPNGAWMPDDDELNAVRDMFAAWELDPNFSIFYHWGIQVDYAGSSGRALPVGPELDRIYKLKFIGLGINETLLTGQGGSYSQAYINMEVQRQRALNLQLRLEAFMHTGVFKPVADLCGFYRVKQAVAGFGGVSNSKFGDVKDISSELKNAFSSVRDFQDNKEFKSFIAARTKEAQDQAARTIREYVYPKLDWGSLSASTDENLKNYLKWLMQNKPHLVDDATLARLARLDRDTQEKAYLEDLRRKRDRLKVIAAEGLMPFVDKKKGDAGAFDVGGGGGIGDISMGGGGGSESDLGGLDLGGGDAFAQGGGAPNEPMGAGGAPESAGGTAVPATPGGAASNLQFERDLTVIGNVLVKEVSLDDKFITKENELLAKAKSMESVALERVINS